MMAAPVRVSPVKVIASTPSWRVSASPAEPARLKPRTVTEPQKAVFASPSASEVAEILAPPEGWPDITDELAEVRFSALQGVDDGVRAELEALRERFGFAGCAVRLRLRRRRPTRTHLET